MSHLLGMDSKLSYFNFRWRPLSWLGNQLLAVPLTRSNMDEQVDSWWDLLSSNFSIESHYSCLVTRSSNVMHARSRDHGTSAHHETSYPPLNLLYTLIMINLKGYLISRETDLLLKNTGWDEIFLMTNHYWLVPLPQRLIKDIPDND